MSLLPSHYLIIYVVIEFDTMVATHVVNTKVANLK